MICICVFIFLCSGVAGGLGSYYVASFFGRGSTAALAGGAVAAFCIVCVNIPSGIGIGYVLEHRTENDVADSFGALLLAMVLPIFTAHIILLSAGFVAIFGALLFAWCEPPRASLLIAILFPFFGLLAGMITGSGGNE